MGRLRRALALATEAGDDAAPATIELSPDGVLAGYQMAAVAPIGPLDRQRVLAATSPGMRLEAVAQLLDDAIEVLEMRLGSPGWE